MAGEDRKQLGITVKKSENISEWYSQVIQKGKFADYTSVSGCMVLRPHAYAIWENIQRIFNEKIKRLGHKNVYFPLFIPEHLFEKEKEHVEGFEPEVAWVERAGDKKLEERLAVRPTSETIFYESYSKWIRSHRDLPLLLNQWCNVVRWEFKHPKPFLRTREFLWQEGHTAHASREEAEKEAHTILKEYVDLIENYLAIPVIAGKKTELEKFPGAEYTLTMETLMPSGKALQMGTSHFLGQNFAKAFDITFLDADGKKKYVWQTSWGISTRLIGALIMVHGDDKGAIIPPRIAEHKIVIVPIYFADSKEKVLAKCKELAEKLANFNPILDDREQYTPGWKFNEWELYGIPLRIELGPKDIQNEQAVLVRRDNNEKLVVPLKGIEKRVAEILELIQNSLFERARKFLQENTVFVSNKEDFVKAIESGKMALAYFCETEECELEIKKETGATNRVIPLDQKETNANCFFCGKPAKRKSYFAKSY